METDELAESLNQRMHFSLAIPNPALGGEIIREPGMLITCARTLWPAGNSALLTAPVGSVAELERKTEAADGCFAARNCRGVLFVADHLAESVRSEAPGVFARHGYSKATPVMGMAANGLAPPARALPDLDYSLVLGPVGHRTVLELNAIAHEAPLEWGEDYCRRINLWSRPLFGIIARLEDRPVACAVTLPFDGRLYAALVATVHEFRGLGCAEAVMRRSLEEAAAATGLSRTTLHATAMGRPLYLRMGYHDTASFTVYAKSQK